MPMTGVDFIESCGLPFFAHRLRRLSELFVEQSGVWLEELGLATPPRAVSTLLLLSDRQPMTVTEIARELRFSHPLIIQLVRTLTSLGLVKVGQDSSDGRRRLVTLTRKGVEEVAALRRTNEAMAQAYRTLFADAKSNGLECIERIEAACLDRSLLDRLRTLAAPRRRQSR